MIDFVSHEARILAQPLNKYSLGSWYFFKIENLWFAHWYYKGVPTKLSIFDDEEEFERFYKYLKKKFYYESKQKQFNPDCEHYNGREVSF